MRAPGGSAIILADFAKQRGGSSTVLRPKARTINTSIRRNGDV